MPHAAAASPTQVDARAMAWLDRLLDASESERAALWAHVATQDPSLEQRVRRLWQASATNFPSAPLRLHPAWEGAAVDARVELRAGDTVAGYRLLGEIGRGGMSVVWLGERADGSLKRQVALKMLACTLPSSHQVERFDRERDVLATLTHPRIARLYDAGVSASGQPFIVLERVEGQPVTLACDARRLGLVERLHVFLQVLDAVDHAHKHLVVHRDIKPSNVMLDAAGQVKLLDFGIAKLLEDRSPAGIESELTREAGCALTPRYSAPEQMANGSISVATDIYSLGVLLYEMTTGTVPHLVEAGSIEQNVHAVLHTAPKAPSRAAMDPGAAALRGFERTGQLQEALAGDLDTIVLKALRKLPSERYGSVERLAGDIRRFLELRPIAARPPAWSYRLGLWARRHRPGLAAASLAAAGLLMLAALLWQQHLQTAAQQARADAVRDFMLDLVEDAEADQSQPGRDVTGKQMLHAGLARAHERFADQPRLLGETLSELGRMLERLGDEAPARQALQDAAGLLESAAPPDDPALNKLRVQQANVAIAENRIEAASALAALALEACHGADPECAKASAYALAALSNIDARQGRTAQSVEKRRRAVEETERGFGAQHAETALAWYAFAMAARNGGELAVAEHAVSAANQIAQRVVMRAKDKMELQRANAVIDLDLGRYAAARATLGPLVTMTPAGIDAAVLQRLLATVALAAGDLPAATEAAQAAIRLASPFADDPEQWVAHLLHARALGLAGQTQAASVEIEHAREALAALGYPPASIEQLRARRFTAELVLNQGAARDAETALAPLAAELAGQGTRRKLELAEVLELRGRAALCLHREAQAQALHGQALAAWQSQLPAGHPTLLRNALYQAQARWSAENTPTHRAELRAAAGAYAVLFQPGSLWQGRAENFRAQVAGAAPDELRCGPGL